MADIRIDNCCNCGNPPTDPSAVVYVGAQKEFSGVTDYPPWMRGSWTWPANGDNFLNVQNGCFVSVHAINASDSGGVLPSQDTHSPVRYLKWQVNVNGTSRIDPTKSSDYTYAEVYDQATNVLVRVEKSGTDQDGITYAYTWQLNDDGSVVETGANFNADDVCPILDIIEENYNDPATFSASMVVTASSATHTFVNTGSPGINVTRTVTKSSLYSLASCVSDAVSMLGDVDLSNFAGPYTIDGVIRAIQWSDVLVVYYPAWGYAVAKTRAIASVAFLWPNGFLGTNTLGALAGKSIRRVGLHTAPDLFIQEWVPPYASTIGPPGDNGSDWALGPNTDCLHNFFGAPGSIVQVGPGMVTFDYGTADPGTCP